MKISLYQRLAISLLLLFIAVSSIFFWWSHNLEQLSRSEAEQRLHLSLATHLAQDNPQLKEGGFDHDALENMFHTLMILGPSFEFYFIAPDGEILTYSAQPGKVKRKTVDLKPILELIEQKTSLPIFADDPRNSSREKIFSVAAIYNNKELKGYLYIIIGGEIYDSIFSGIQSNQQLAQSIGLVFGAFVFFFVVLLGLLRYLTLPLKELTNDIRKFRSASFDSSNIQFRKWPNHEHNEVHELGQTFNQMARQINHQLTQLKENDQQRRELLSHLSHDLRTPLASLQGYLETVKLKGKQLSEEQHLQFIAIAFKNANQLKKLIDQIFELAHLEGGEVSVAMEDFPLTELLHDIVAKFSKTLNQKNMSISILPSDQEFNVSSDLEKLERVLTNLIENALRHSANGSEIQLAITSVNRTNLNLSVIDHGTGIAAKDLADIFEARYRADNAIDDNRMHTGLGLAISQRLMKLMNSEITVKSQLDHGSTFIFSLKRVG